MITQCSAALLESALAGTLPTEDENSLQHHLKECEACGAELERMAGGSAWCREAASLLGADALDAALPARDDWSEVDFTVEHLEPTDEPNVLGRLGGYDVLEVIGRGGTSVVLKGFDRELKRFVAIKVLAPHLAQSALAKKRFAREAQAAAAVVHPHVLAIHQVQPQGRLPYLVMPLVAGESLAQRLASRGVLELKEVLRIGIQAAAGLAAAHEQGLVHRDVKPANILLEKGVERAVLTDFGLARAADDVSLTRYGIIAGTPQFMSPEQAKGEAVDGRSDLFSLGCVLYEMAGGVSPFRADSTMATLRRLIDDPPRALESLNPELPPWFVAIVDRLLEKDPSRRFRSAKEVSELLEGCLAHVQQPANIPLPAGVRVVKPMAAATRSAPRWSKWRRFGAITAILLLVLGGFGAFLMFTDEPTDISGEWTSEGEGWGKVVLRRTGPNKYAGTFSDTIGTESGKIELKWSRIERRYNGAWSEGEDRFGKLSVRSVGGEIRGAFTTSRESRINPGTPELADLLWVRAKAAAQKKDTPTESGKKPPEVTWEFGPVHNNQLICPESDRDPSRKRLLEGGQWNGTALRLEDGRSFNLPVKPVPAKGDMSPEEFVKWCDETKVNLVIDYRTETGQWELRLRNVRFADLPSLPPDPVFAPPQKGAWPVSDWNTLSAHELQKRFPKLEWRKTTPAVTDPKGKGFQSLLLERGLQPPGITFAFETSDGRRGILQFFRSNKTPLESNVRIRFKLLQPAETPAKKDLPSDIGKKPPEVSEAFGPVLSRRLFCPGSFPDTKGDAPVRLPAIAIAQRNGNGLRLENGELIPLPAKSAPGKGDLGDISPEELAKWFDETKVNLAIDYRRETDQWELKLRQVRLADVATIPSSSFDDWKTLSANELQERFSKLEWRKTTPAGADAKGKGFQSLLLLRGERLGMTFAFETSDGHRGILQFTGSMGSSSGYLDASVRFKLLQPTDGGSKTPAAMEPVKAPPKQEKEPVKPKDGPLGKSEGGGSKTPAAVEPVKAPPKQEKEPVKPKDGPVKPKDGPLGMKFVPLPKGTFFMGGGGGKAGKKTEIKTDFEIAIYTVTQGQWQAVMGKNPSFFSRDGRGKDWVEDIKDDELKLFPVENVSWEATQEFLKKLNEKEAGRGYLYRLPTDAEWEYACRGGATSEEECSFDFYLDKPTNDLSSKQANFHGDYPAGKADKGPFLGRPIKVGSYAPNKLGLYDMHGNVWQWCDTLYDRTSSTRVIYGGCWTVRAQNCAAGNRCRGRPVLVNSSHGGHLGFRLARLPDSKGDKHLGFRLARLPDSKGDNPGKTEPKSDSPAK